MYKISIIIPVHNEEKYLKECVESIINQTMNFRDIEVIMIDDASEDNSYNIIQNYSKQYNNFIALKRNEKSGSAGRPRNEALEYVHGKYIMFIDADDTYEKDACEIMYNAIEETNSDFVTANAANVEEDGKTRISVFMDENKYNNQLINMDMLKNDVLPMSCSVCFKIFSADFVKKNNLKFLEGVPAEDSYFSYSALMKADKAYFINKIIYNYRKRFSENNLSTSTNFSIKYFRNINLAYNTIYKKFKENGYIECYKIYYLNSMLYVLFNFITSNKLNEEEICEVINMLKWLFDVLDELKINLSNLDCDKEFLSLICEIKSGNVGQAYDILQSIKIRIKDYSKDEIRNIKLDLKAKMILN